MLMFFNNAKALKKALTPIFNNARALKNRELIALAMLGH